jgi:serine/threonine protein kinase/tetratricopeptide (TPR) repeat protein
MVAEGFGLALNGGTVTAEPDAVAASERPAAFAGESPGACIGRYRLLERIGEGGMGSVWMAEQLEPVRRRVALKLIKPGMDSEQVLARFEAERQALALMDHPNIAKIFDAGVTGFAESQIHGGRPYFVMELVQGVPLTKFCDEGQLSIRERLELFLPVCQAIQHAHQKGIIHRDIKPSNVLVALYDGQAVPKVIDFGIAKATVEPLTERTVFTEFGALIGTPEYMSPEQAQLNQLDIDTRSDLYSLGVLLYELLTSTTPLSRETLRQSAFDEILRRIREEEPPKLSTRVTARKERLDAVAARRRTDGTRLVRQLRGELDWIVMKALEKDRNRRYETANELGLDLQRHLDDEPVMAGPPSGLYRFKKLLQRHKAAFAAASFATAALLVALGVSLQLLAKEKEARVRAVTAETRQASLRQQAEAQTKIAQEQTAQARQVTRFLKDIWQSVHPHNAAEHDTILLRQILDGAAERIGRELPEQPQVEAELRMALAEGYFTILRYEDAEKMIREAIRLYQICCGEKNANAADALSKLGQILAARGDYTEAENTSRRAIAMQRSLSEPTMDLAHSLMRLADVLRRRKDLAAAESTALEAIQTANQLGHPDHIEFLIDYAEVLRDRGKYQEEESTLRKLLTIQEQIGTNHPGLAHALNDLAIVCNHQGKSKEAESHLRRAVAIAQKYEQNEFHLLGMALSNLADLVLDRSDFGAAQSLYGEALRHLRKDLQTHKGAVVHCLASLAAALREEKRYAEAETSAREALSLARQYFTNDWVKLDSAFDELSRALRAQRRYSELEPLYAEALPITRRVWAQEPCQLAKRIFNVALIFFRQAKYAQAEPFAHEAFSLTRDYCRDELSVQHQAGRFLAETLQRQKKYDQAEPYWLLVLEISRQLSTNEPTRIAEALEGLATVRRLQNKFAEAETNYRELQQRESQLALDDPQRLLSTFDRADFLATWAAAEHARESSRAPALAREGEQLLRDCLRALSTYPETSRRLAETRSRLGAALITVAQTDSSLTAEGRAAKFTEAESLVLQGAEVLGRSPSVGSKIRREAWQRVVQLYEAWGKPSAAADWRKKLSTAEN